MMYRFLMFAVVSLSGIAAIAAAGGPPASFWSGLGQAVAGDRPSSAQPRLASSGPRLMTGAIF